MVQVDNEGMISKGLEGFIVMTVHIANEKVKDSHVDEVSQATALVIWWRVADVLITVVRVRLPGGLASLMVRPPVRMSPHLPRKRICKRVIDDRPNQNLKLGQALPFVEPHFWMAKKRQSCLQLCPDSRRWHEQYHSSNHIYRGNRDCSLKERER